MLSGLIKVLIPVYTLVTGFVAMTELRGSFDEVLYIVILLPFLLFATTGVSEIFRTTFAPDFIIYTSTRDRFWKQVYWSGGIHFTNFFVVSAALAVFTTSVSWIWLVLFAVLVFVASLFLSVIDFSILFSKKSFSIFLAGAVVYTLAIFFVTGRGNIVGYYRQKYAKTFGREKSSESYQNTVAETKVEEPIATPVVTETVSTPLVKEESIQYIDTINIRDMRLGEVHEGVTPYGTKIWVKRLDKGERTREESKIKNLFTNEIQLMDGTNVFQKNMKNGKDNVSFWFASHISDDSKHVNEDRYRNISESLIEHDGKLYQIKMDHTREAFDNSIFDLNKYLDQLGLNINYKNELVFTKPLTEEEKEEVVAKEEVKEPAKKELKYNMNEVKEVLAIQGYVGDNAVSRFENDNFLPVDNIVDEKVLKLLGIKY